MCTKCVIDSGHLSAVAVWLSLEVQSFKGTIADLFKADPAGVAVHTLTDAEHTEIVKISQEWCDLAEKIEKRVEDWNYRLRTITEAHSYPHTKK